MDKDFRFIPHAEDKFRDLAERGFAVTREQVSDTVLHPDSVQAQGRRWLARKVVSQNYRLNVVFTEDAEAFTIITFFPSRRSRQ